MAERPFLSEVYLNDEVKALLHRRRYKEGRRPAEPKPEVKNVVLVPGTIEKVNNLEETKMKK